MHTCGFHVVGNTKSVSAMFSHLAVIVGCCSCLACKLNFSFLQPDLIGFYTTKCICRGSSGVGGSFLVFNVTTQSHTFVKNFPLWIVCLK